jgi:polyisoprenoid-binding protein YceI
MTNKFARLALGAVAATLLALPSFAQSAEWRVDSNHSSARISIQAQSPDARGPISLGAAASGILRVDGSNPAHSTIELDLYPAGGETAADDPAETTQLIFRSQKASLTADGKLKLTGTLTVSRVVREVQLEGNEGYSGPVESGRVIYQTTREESLILAIPAATRDGQGSAFTEVSTSLNISPEDFPELVNEAFSTNWPAKAQDRNCDTSASSGEDYSGTVCTGTAVESRSANRAAASFSEDYAGGEPVSAQPPHVVTVALHLRLAPQGVQVSAKTGR